MNHYAGIDVSLEESSVCVIDGAGKVLQKGKVPSEPEALIAWFRSLGVAFVRIGLEAGPLSQWLYAGMQQAGLPVELLETRHVRTAFKIMPVKTDRKDARGIADLMRLGWLRPVHCKSMEAQETRAMLTARKLVVTGMRSHVGRTGAWPRRPSEYRCGRCAGIPRSRVPVLAVRALDGHGRRHSAGGWAEGDGG